MPIVFPPFNISDAYSYTRPFFVSDYLLTFTGQIKLIMKLNLKLCAALIAGLLISINSFSQTRIAIGGIGSKNLASVGRYTEESEEEYGAYFGLLSDVRLSRKSNVYLETGVLYGYVGDKYRDASENMHSINVPLRLKYKAPVTSEGDIIFFGGARFQYGLAANIKQGDVSMNLYGDDPLLNRFDVKAGIGAGIAVSLVEIRLGYEWGLMDMNPSDIKELHINQFFVGVAFNL